MNGRRNEFFGERMHLQDMMLVMTGGDITAVSCLTEMLKLPNGLNDIHFLNDLGLDGRMIATLWNDACGQDLNKLEVTIEAFKAGEFTEEQIHENLNSWNVEPFV